MLLLISTIIIVMCPDKKLNWFAKRGWSQNDIEEVRELVIKRWEESYNKPMAQEDVLATSPPTTGPLQTVNPVESQFILTD